MGRCQGYTRRGIACPNRAKHGDPPRWCANCDPAQAERRRIVGGKARLLDGAARKRLAPSLEKRGIASVVNACIRAAQAVKDGQLSPARGRAIASLLNVATNALRVELELREGPEDTEDLSRMIGALSGQETERAA